jgi:hypothetical protein
MSPAAFSRCWLAWRTAPERLDVTLVIDTSRKRKAFGQETAP